MNNHSKKERPEFSGLSTSDVIRRQTKYGLNIVYKKKHVRPVVAFIKKFNSPLLLMLIGTSIFSLFLGQAINASIILIMVFFSAVMDFVNTRKSQIVADHLIAQVASTATVWRDGRKREVSLHMLVPGDVIDLSAGDVIPADCRMLVADDFFVNQSTLTGESLPVEKHTDEKAWNDLLKDGEDMPLDSNSFAFAGTSVITGFGTAVVLRTGGRTQCGRIAETLSNVPPETDFDRGLRNMSSFIIRLTFVMVVMVFAINSWMGHGLLTSLLFSIAIAVGLTPELLPVILSVSLARGSLVMAKKQVIVKNLPSIQNFGAMDIFCTDKTGTLTEDHIVLVKCLDGKGNDSEEVMLYSYVSSVMYTAVKSPLDTAICERAKMDISPFVKVDEVPFDFHRRRDSMVVDRGDDRIMITKGAPEDVLGICDFYDLSGTEQPLSDDLRKEILKEFEALSADGYRVLGVSRKVIPKEARNVYKPEEEKEMAFLGFAAFLDPPKKTSLAALQELEKLHIEVKIVTGDSEILTERICRDISLSVRGVMVGSEITALSDSELGIKAESTTIFARVSPEGKERVISALRKRGHVVGYMGDGINDAPVLRAADVGISVNNAVDVAKETADIILLNKSLEVLSDGVTEGRKTFQNTLKYIKMGFSSNFGNMFSMVGASAFLPFLPMLPAQILFNNFLYDLSQSTLSTDNTDEEDIKKPLRWNMNGFGRYLFVFGLASSVFDFLTFFALYKIFSLNAPGFQAGWFMESIATQVLIVYIIRTKRTPFFRSSPSLPLVLSTLGVVFFAWIIPYTPIGEILSFSPLSGTVLFALMSIVLSYLFIGEIVKTIFYRVNRGAL